MFGPVEGRRHDSGILRESGLYGELERYAVGADQQVVCLYGDSAYPASPHLRAPFKGAALSDEQKQFNSDMSAFRVSVEWQFGKVAQQFAFLDYKKNLKLFLQPVGKLYMVGALLTSCHTCLYGSQSQDVFFIQPPTLEYYLQG